MIFSGVFVSEGIFYHQICADSDHGERKIEVDGRAFT